MVTCRCGCTFDNSRQDSHVMCPRCKRIYANSAPNLFHPLSEDEKRWKCEACGAVNENSHAGAPRGSCTYCQAVRPGKPDSWY